VIRLQMSPPDQQIRNQVLEAGAIDILSTI
jgi:hypothetical protein